MKRVVIVVFPGVQALDVVGPLDVFVGATRLAEAKGRRAGYDCALATRDGRAVAAGSGLRLTPDVKLGDLRGPIDTLLVAGAFDIRPALEDRALVAGITTAARRARRVASVCSGAALLAEAGLLDGRRATTHWAYLDILAARAPRVRVERGPIHVADGNVHTSAGVTAGMDMVPYPSIPESIAVRPQGDKVYIAGSGRINTFDPSLDAFTHSTVVPPSNFGLAVTPSGDRVVATANGGGYVVVVSTATDTILGEVEVPTLSYGGGPFALTRARRRRLRTTGPRARPARATSTPTGPPRRARRRAHCSCRARS